VRHDCASGTPLGMVAPMHALITGANRGIGLELVRQLAARGDTVTALVRDPGNASALTNLAAESAGRVRVLAADIGDDASVRRAAADPSVANEAIDLLINNAGTMGKMQSLAELDLDDVKRTFDTNALGPIRVTRAFLPQLLRSDSRRVVHVTSGMGSIADNASGGAYGYRMSKAALNMANMSMCRDFAAQRLCCVVINPGWVQTDMGGGGAPTPVTESVQCMLAKIDALGPKDSGRFLDYKRADLPY
jgi:NAD(P)-dependent dehydrogenase (short-subunit alcohol dehydrogenase family)